jgi:oxygen-dependent protoporphyrinogen oxidase
MSGPSIAVVGAGMAGIAATAQLRAAGAEATLIERGAAGGRAREREAEGFRLEAAPLLVGARDRSLHALARGLASADTLPLVRPSAPVQLHEGELRPVDPVDLRGLRRLPGMPLREGWRLLRLERLLRRFEALLDAEHPEHATRLDDRSVADFVRLYFGEAALARFVAPLLRADLGLECADASRVAFLRHHVGRAGLGLGRLRTSVAALGAQLTHGASLRAGDVRALRPSPAGYELALANGARVEVEAVVLATPPSESVRVAGDLLSAPEADFFAASDAEAAIVASFACEGALVPHALWVRVPPDAGLPIACVALEPGVEGGFAPPGQTLAQLVATPLWSHAHLDAAEDAIARSLGAALERVRPGALRGARLLEIARFEWARPRFDVGRYRALARFAGVQADRRARGRRLYFAGDYLNAPTLEGAATSGRAAAEAALADLGAARSSAALG